MANPQIRISPDVIQQLRIKFPGTAWMKDRELVEWALTSFIIGASSPPTPQQPDTVVAESKLETPAPESDDDTFDFDDI